LSRRFVYLSFCSFLLLLLLAAAIMTEKESEAGARRWLHTCAVLNSRMLVIEHHHPDEWREIGVASLSIART